METIIKKAIEGGWRSLLGKNIDYCYDGIVVDIVGDGEMICISHKEMVCDPLFWQALGRACGWKGLGIWKHPENREMMEWEMYAMEFYQRNLTEGWEKAVEYLLEVIKEKHENK